MTRCAGWWGRSTPAGGALPPGWPKPWWSAWPRSSAAVPPSCGWLLGPPLERAALKWTNRWRRSSKSCPSGKSSFPARSGKSITWTCGSATGSFCSLPGCCRNTSPWAGYAPCVKAIWCSPTGRPGASGAAIAPCWP